jgi:hypothetical protein
MKQVLFVLALAAVTALAGIRDAIVAAPVPEPAGWALMAGGLASLLWMGRRKRREISWQR